MLSLSLKILTSSIERRKLNLLRHISLVLCTSHFLMINWLRCCVIVLLWFLNVGIEHMFVFPKIILHAGEKIPKTTKLLAKAHENFFKMFDTKLIFYNWQFTTHTENRHPNENWTHSILDKSLFIHLYKWIHVLTYFKW